MNYFEEKQYIKLVEELKEKHSEFPSTLSLETLSLCNGYCSFCPYEKLTRKGKRLSDKDIDKIVGEIIEFPEELDLNIVLSRVNEPFLDKRWFDISRKILKAKKNVGFGFFSNGSTINEDVINKLNDLGNVQYLNVSLNYCNKLEYEKNIRLNFEKILSNVKLLHEKKVAGKFKPQVLLSRVGSNDDKDDRFYNWVKENYPEFRIRIIPGSDWLGSIEHIDSKPCELPCRQWFQLHILADGREAFCCMDADGRYGSAKISEMSLYEMYNRPKKKIVRQYNTRKQIEICRKCSLLP